MNVKQFISILSLTSLIAGSISTYEQSQNHKAQAMSSIVDSYRTQSAYKKDAGYQEAISKAKTIDNNKLNVQSFNDFTKNNLKLRDKMSGVGTLRIKNEKNDRYGTAFVIDKHTIITNNHVVRDKSYSDIYKYIKPSDMEFRPSREGNSIPYKFKIKDVKMLKNVDIAVLHTYEDVTKYVKPIPFASEYQINHQAFKSKLYGIGYPDVKYYFPNSNLKRYQKLIYNGYYLQPTYSLTPQFYTKMIIRNGSSGSPILNSKYQLVGVNSSGFNNSGKMTWDASPYEMAYVQALTGQTRKDIIKQMY